MRTHRSQSCASALLLRDTPAEATQPASPPSLNPPAGPERYPETARSGTGNGWWVLSRRHHPPVSGFSLLYVNNITATICHQEQPRRHKDQPSVDMRIHQTGSLALGDPSYHDLRLARIAGSHHCQPKRYCGEARLEPECRLLGTANAGSTVSVVKQGGGGREGCFLATGQASCSLRVRTSSTTESVETERCCCSAAMTSVHTGYTLPPPLPRHATASLAGPARLAETTRQHAAASPRDRGMRDG